MVRHCLWKICATPGARINETGLLSSAAVVSQCESTELCSLAAVAPQIKSTELCSSAAVLCNSPAVALQLVAQRPAS